MISIYSSAFNLLKNKFDFEWSIKNFTSFADEVVIAVNNSTDDTLQELKKLECKFCNLRLVECNYSYEDPLLDGKIKNFALQNTTQDYCISLDMDEYIPSWQYMLWRTLAYSLGQDNCDCYMIPSVNLYKDNDHYFSITSKWYLHKTGLFRGAVNFAKNSDGTIDTSKSDSCELLNVSGDLVKSRATPNSIEDLRTNSYPFVIHTGYKSLEDRVLRNQNFWIKHWKTESGGDAPKHKVHENINEFTETPIKHSLYI
jgi:glycosyltransferase involved in cell wall biosynthesis